MTNDNMQVVFNKDDIKTIMIKLLDKTGIEIKDDKTDIIVVELPDNEENGKKKRLTEKDIHVWLSGLPIEDKIRELMEKPYGKIIPKELCESIKQILSADRNAEVFYRMKLIGNGRTASSVGKYHLLIIVRLEESISGYAELLKYMLENIKEKLKVTSEFLFMNKNESGRQRLFADFQKKWILLGNFAEYYMKKNELPEPGVLTKLSAARYEGSESEARIYFTKDAIDMVEEFSADGKADRVIEERNLRMIRKIMEISKRNSVYLYAENNAEEEGGKIIHTVSGLVQCREKQDEDTYVKFSGFMHWSLFEKAREVFKYYHGEYQFNVSEERYAYLKDIKRLKGVDINMIEKLVEILRKQKHGTAAVLFDENTDAAKEANRLCNMKRGTRIRSNIRYDRNKAEWNEEQILSITGIDGALFIDHEGKCLAIGVIVDGEVVKEGDVGRGARYNSIVNYMEWKPGCVGIIVSEDGMVNIIQK